MHSLQDSHLWRVVPVCLTNYAKSLLNLFDWACLIIKTRYYIHCWFLGFQDLILQIVSRCKGCSNPTQPRLWNCAVPWSFCGYIIFFFPGCSSLPGFKSAAIMIHQSGKKIQDFLPFEVAFYRMQIPPVSLHSSPSPICTASAHFCWFSSSSFSSPVKCTLPSKGLCEGLHRRHAKNVGLLLWGNPHVNRTTKWKPVKPLEWAGMAEISCQHVADSIVQETHMIKIQRGNNIGRPQE